LDGFDGVEIVQILVRSFGPGTADIASSWASTFGLTSVQVWADTTDYMRINFLSTISGTYPSALVVDLDTMEIRYFEAEDVMATDDVVNTILDADHPCAE
jgi:hypothetical protein